MAALFTTLRSSSFSPTTVSSLVAWYDFADATTLFTDTGRTTAVTADADIIKGVTDKSGTGKHLSEATNAPQYKTGIQNGRSGARSVSKLLTSSAFTALNSPFTLFCVATKKDAAHATNGTIFTAVGNFSPAIYVDSATNNWTFYAGTAVVSSTVADTSCHEIHGVFNGASSTLTQDGTDIATGNVGTTATSTTFQLGHTTASHNYDFFEIILYNAAVSAGNIALIKAYLKAKWGTP